MGFGVWGLRLWFWVFGVGSETGELELQFRVLCLVVTVQGSGFRVQCSVFSVQCPGLRIQGSGFRVHGSGFMVQGSWFMVQGSRFRVQGSGFRVQGSGFSVQGSVVPTRVCRCRVQRLGLRVEGLLLFLLLNSRYRS